VKYFLKTGRNQPSLSVSISAEPAAREQLVATRHAQGFADGARMGEAEPRGAAYFLDEGETWSVRDVVAFVDTLKKV